VRPDWEAIQEDGERECMENSAPGVEVNAADGVAKEETPEGGLGTCHHDLQVWFPVELVVDEDP